MDFANEYAGDLDLNNFEWEELWDITEDYLISSVGIFLEVPIKCGNDLCKDKALEDVAVCSKHVIQR